ncbi:uncharacterized protein HMPREF1541_04310 [Cyphellophora europaea CBS 101466]|uniref:Methyltransferase domain-containing protein n=1 Tax=Cyphellophora europaea (strain CBS 101466) TaxID=1220924 RepID=W2RUQ4_CYPE1|nr:uncharacterized protein HMPREF1541_04310 [Cyphellophora europaea CBS 101466]ETN40035.1 hypothetical protein HMPREF1541_04310 [Cyphellophora europaea CBS 101466]
MNHSTSAKDWSASLYLKFEKERSRPSRDLLAQVPLDNPHRVVDLGCGPGNSTAILRDRYPAATLSGIDSSPDMLNKARATLPSIPFHQADLTTYHPTDAVDLFFSNAVFQWLPESDRIPTIKRLLQSQAPGAVFALQVPDNFHEPSHAAMRETAETGPWAATLRPLQPARGLMPSPQVLYDALKPLCAHVDLWHSHYYHVLQDHGAVVEWVKGTGLRPFIDPLSEGQRREFLEVYLGKLRQLYPRSVDGRVILRYPRLFVVATRA